MSMPYAAVAHRALVLALAALGSALLVGAAAPTAPPSVPDASGSSDATPADASRCWPSCVSCESRCAGSGRERAGCLDSCHDAGASCCEANGKQGVFKMCGCR